MLSADYGVISGAFTHYPVAQIIHYMEKDGVKCSAHLQPARRRVCDCAAHNYALAQFRCAFREVYVFRGFVLFAETTQFPENILTNGQADSVECWPANL